MIASLRRRHARTWLVLGPLLIALLALLVLTAPPAPGAASRTTAGGAP